VLTNGGKKGQRIEKQFWIRERKKGKKGAMKEV
jgi:hypothetical protein